MIVKTETGSTYRFDDARSVVRREEPTHDLRHDGEWLNVLREPYIEVGESMCLALERPGTGKAFIRTTSRVTEVRA